MKEYVEYIKRQSYISIPQLQANFDLSYSKASKIISELARKGDIEFDKDIYYKVLIKEREIQKRNRGRSFRKRFHSFNESEDYEDDVTNDEEEELDGIKAFLKSLEKDIDRKDNLINSMKNSVKLKDSISIGLANHILYPDFSFIRIQILEKGEQIYFNDCGNTIAYLKKVNKYDEEMQTKINAIIKEYGVEIEDDALIIDTVINDDALSSWIHLYTAIHIIMHL